MPDFVVVICIILPTFFHALCAFTTASTPPKSTLYGSLFGCINNKKRTPLKRPFLFFIDEFYSLFTNLMRLLQSSILAFTLAIFFSILTKVF